MAAARQLDGYARRPRRARISPLLLFNFWQNPAIDFIYIQLRLFEISRLGALFWRIWHVDQTKLESYLITKYGKQFGCKILILKKTMQTIGIFKNDDIAEARATDCHQFVMGQEATK